MIRQIFSSDRSKDSIEINYLPKFHKSSLNILTIDKINAHIELLGNVITFLKNNSIQWVAVPVHKNPIYPENIVYYINDKTNKICCHIEDFENFYLKNLAKMIKFTNICISKNTDITDGWSTVTNKNKQQEDKYNQIKQEITTLMSNWNDLHE
jgi:hypothetical protein